jgi:hypothetical protein
MDQYVSEAQARTGLGFADQERLDQLRTRHQEIEDELNTAAEPSPAAPAPADEPAAIDVSDVEPLGLD